MKSNLLYKISLVIFGVSLAALVAAMIFCAFRGDESKAVALVAIVSAAFAFVGIILACLSSKLKPDKEET